MIDIHTEGLDELIQKLEKADEVFHNWLKIWLEAMGVEFLDIVQDEIISQEIVDTRGLANSFQKTLEGNVWVFTSGGINLTLETGTNLEYASFVNDGYPTVTAKSASFTMKDGTLVRWVPGEWTGNGFEYRKGAKTGMLLKERFIPGRPYFTDAENIFKLIFNRSLEKKLQQWIEIFIG